MLQSLGRPLKLLGGRVFEPAYESHLLARKACRLAQINLGTTWRRLYFEISGALGLAVPLVRGTAAFTHRRP